MVVWDTNLRAERFVCLRKHAAAVTHMAVTANLVLSLAADRTLHAHDISDDSETGQGKLVFRRRLPASLEPLWVELSRALPLALVGSTGCVRVLDMQATRPSCEPTPHPPLPSTCACAAPAPFSRAAPDAPPASQGELIAKLSAPPRCTLDLGRPGPCAFVSAALASLVCVVATAGPDTTAEGAPDTETTAEAEAEAVGRALATEASSDGAPALARFDLDATLLACYPHVTGLLSDPPTAQQLRHLLAFSHAQRLDAAALAQGPFLAQGTPLLRVTGNPTSRRGSQGASRRSAGRRLSRSSAPAGDAPSADPSDSIGARSAPTEANLARRSSAASGVGSAASVSTLTSSVDRCPAPMNALSAVERERRGRFTREARLRQRWQDLKAGS